MTYQSTCRTPQECVDRNTKFGIQILDSNNVALHRSAWIEISLFACCYAVMIVALHRSAWIEILSSIKASQSS